MTMCSMPTFWRQYEFTGAEEQEQQQHADWCLCSSKNNNTLFAQHDDFLTSLTLLNISTDKDDHACVQQMCEIKALCVSLLARIRKRRPTVEPARKPGVCICQLISRAISRARKPRTTEQKQRGAMREVSRDIPTASAELWQKRASWKQLRELTPTPQPSPPGGGIRDRVKSVERTANLPRLSVSEEDHFDEHGQCEMTVSSPTDADWCVLSEK